MSERSDRDISEARSGLDLKDLDADWIEYVLWLESENREEIALCNEVIKTNKMMHRTGIALMIIILFVLAWINYLGVPNGQS